MLPAVVLRAAALAGAVALAGCGGDAKTARCVPSCPDPASCRDSCGGLSCPCAPGDVCDSGGACRACVAGACRAAVACADECGNPDLSCATRCAHPDTCLDDCGVAGTPTCAGAECDPSRPGACLDTCGLYAARCCCLPTACLDASRCDDDCGNSNPALCKGRTCGGACQDTCGEPDAACWSSCTDPTRCLDDCGNFNALACAGLLCDPNKPGFDTCGSFQEGC